MDNKNYLVSLDIGIVDADEVNHNMAYIASKIENNIKQANAAVFNSSMLNGLLFKNSLNRLQLLLKQVELIRTIKNNSSDEYIDSIYFDSAISNLEMDNMQVRDSSLQCIARENRANISFLEDKIYKYGNETITVDLNRYYNINNIKFDTYSITPIKIINIKLYLKDGSTKLPSFSQGGSSIYGHVNINFNTLYNDVYKIEFNITSDYYIYYAGKKPVNELTPSDLISHVSLDNNKVDRAYKYFHININNFSIAEREEADNCSFKLKLKTVYNTIHFKSYDSGNIQYFLDFKTNNNITSVPVRPSNNLTLTYKLKNPIKTGVIQLPFAAYGAVTLFDNSYNILLTATASIDTDDPRKLMINSDEYVYFVQYNPLFTKEYSLIPYLDKDDEFNIYSKEKIDVTNNANDNRYIEINCNYIPDSSSIEIFAEDNNGQIVSLSSCNFDVNTNVIFQGEEIPSMIVAGKLVKIYKCPELFKYNKVYIKYKSMYYNIVNYDVPIYYNQKGGVFINKNSVHYPKNGYDEIVLRGEKIEIPSLDANDGTFIDDLFIYYGDNEI